MSEVILDGEDMRRTLGRMAHEVLETNHGAHGLAVVGIMSRGWPIAKRLAFLMTQIEGATVPCGRLDVSRYRDDRPAPDEDEDETEIPFEVSGSKVLLVDEVIYTGRTIRAAMDALLRFGRPSEIQLAVLIDRGHRELPISPNFCGRAVPTEREDRIVVRVNEYDGEDAVVLETKQEAGV